MQTDLHEYKKPARVSLTKGEQVALLKLSIDGDSSAKNKLWSLAICSILKHLRNKKIPDHMHQDIIQEWALKFLELLRKFPQHKETLSPNTYFFMRSQNSIRDFVLRQGYQIRIPREGTDGRKHAIPKCINHDLLVLADLN